MRLVFSLAACQAIAALHTERSDTLNYVTTGRRLVLPRAPSCGVPTLMEALHADLSHDFLGDEGVRLGLQTCALLHTGVLSSPTMQGRNSSAQPLSSRRTSG